jgi:hypothetical protein
MPQGEATTMRSTKVSISLMLVMSFVTADAAETDHHHHGDAGTALQRNAGQLWMTDAALRESMAALRVTFASHHQEIHNGSLSADGYTSLATTTENTIARVIAQCQLEPEADAQLHLILSKLMDAAQEMRHTTDLSHARRAAIQAINALNAYPEYFDDPSFVPIEEREVSVLKSSAIDKEPSSPHP